MKTNILNLLTTSADNQELKMKVQQLFTVFKSSVQSECNLIKHIEFTIWNDQNLDNFQTHYFTALANVYPRAFFKSKDKNTTTIFIGDLFNDLNFESQKMLEGTNDQIKKLIGSTKLFYTSSFYYNEKDARSELKNEQFKKLIVPQVELAYDHNQGNISIRLNQLTETIEKHSLGEVPLKFKHHDFIDCGPSQWNAQIDQVINLISDKKIEKLALARTKTLNINDKVNAISCIIKDPQNHYVIIFSSCPEFDFVSLTPERLFKVENGIIEIDVVAGTIARGENVFEDETLANQLLHDPKNIIEHELVNDSIKKIMSENNYHVTQEKHLSILKQKYIQHIYSLIACPIKEDTKMSDLIQILHPTPAVGISPKTESLLSIYEIEQFNRNHYAAPIGVISKDFVDIAVGIRCIQFIQNSGIMYAGAGIVKNSNGAEEWKETENKFKTIFHKISQDFGHTSTLKV